jgi:hypothetical protein
LGLLKKTHFYECPPYLQWDCGHNASKPIEDDPQVIPRLSTRHFLRKSACREAEAEGANLLGCQEKQNCDESAFKGSSRDEKE